MTGVDNFRLALVQMACNASREVNLERARTFIRDAATDGARLVCLPELFLSPYFCQTEDQAHFDLAEPVPGPTTEELGNLARELGVVLVVPLFEKRAAGLYHNSVVTLDADGSLAGHYRKMHIPDDPSYYEKFYFTPGDRGFPSVDTAAGPIGTLICWDQWYPEAARLAVLQGAHLLVYPTAIGWLPHEVNDPSGQQQLEAWKTVQRSHAIANGCYVAAVNRVGDEASENGGLHFWGHSFVCDPLGQVLVEAGEVDEEVILVDIDHVHLETVRREWPFLRDRRIDAYEGITRRFEDGS